MKIRLNDAWDVIPLEYVDNILGYFQERLQPTHPLRDRKLFPVAKRERQEKYLLEDDDDRKSIWVLDFGAKRRVKGRTCFAYKQFQSQEDLDVMMSQEYEEWMQEMKDAGT